ncbi:MAG: helix-turn-helix transcriptional regulator [Actinomycetota bacterium]|nr:helix-turn-helix transcriptional regulator [Nitrospiraceae bacterium]MDA8157205.1 helix-turn-helix transcriptional regulator [Actinomycetota bacterium]
MGKTTIYNFSNLEDPAYEAKIIRAIGKNIRNLRQARKLTQEELSYKASINAKYLGEIERGEKNPTGLVIFKLAQILKAPISEIMPYSGYSGLLLEVEKLFEGKKPDDLKKAVKLMECFLNLVNDERETK